MKVKPDLIKAPDYIPLNSSFRSLTRYHKFGPSRDRLQKMAGRNGGGGGSFFDRNLVPRIRRYLEDNSNRKYIDVDEMADTLQNQYFDYGRKKKIPFKNAVRQGNHHRQNSLLVISKTESFFFSFPIKPMNRFAHRLK
jgi:hypothetical protein